ncbi:hypothetical protein ACF1B4_03140 [Streptomyces albidoflavus]
MSRIKEDEGEEDESPLPWKGVGSPDCEELDPYGGDVPVEKIMGTENHASAGYSRKGHVLVEQVYSGTPASLLDRTGRLFRLMAACPAYTQILSFGAAGTAEVEITGHEVEVTGVKGTAFGYEATSRDTAAGGPPSRHLTVAVVRGWTTVLLQGSPTLVKEALEPALRKVAGSRRNASEE